MNALVLGLVSFFGAHSVSIVNDPWRNRMVAGGLALYAAFVLLSLIHI